MKKIIHAIEWGMILYMVALVSFSMIGVGDDNDQYPPRYINFETGKPAVYRVLVPLLAKGLIFLLDIQADLSLALVMLASGIGAYWVMKKLFRLYGAEHFAPFAFMLTFSILMNHATPLDLMTVLLFSLAFYLLASRRFDLYYILFPVIVLHRETAVLLILLYAIFRPSLMGLVYQSVTFAILRSLLVMTFADSPGTENIGYLFLYDVTGAYLQTPAVWVAAALLALAGIIIASRWMDYDPFLRCALLLFPVQIVLHLLVGNPFEVRVMAESFPIFWLMFATGIQGLFQRPVLPALHHGKERLKQGGIE